MAIEVTIPRQITAGDDVSWVDNLPSYSSSIYQLTYAIRGVSALDLTATAVGSSFQTTITNAQSSTLSAGTYSFQANLTEISTSKRINIANGQITVLANLAAATAPYDGRSQNEKHLAAITAAITTILAGGAVQRYKIFDRELENHSLKELREMEAYYRTLVLREQSARGDRPNVRNLYAGFGTI